MSTINYADISDSYKYKNAAELAVVFSLKQVFVASSILSYTITESRRKAH